jgi:hypothetical protein
LGCFRRVGFSPLQFCLTEKTLSCANEAPIWGRQLGLVMTIASLKSSQKVTLRAGSHPQLVGDLCRGGRPISREDLSDVIVTAGITKE